MTIWQTEWRMRVWLAQFGDRTWRLDQAWDPWTPELQARSVTAMPVHLCPTIYRWIHVKISPNNMMHKTFRMQNQLSYNVYVVVIRTMTFSISWTQESFTFIIQQYFNTSTYPWLNVHVQCIKFTKYFPAKSAYHEYDQINFTKL